MESRQEDNEYIKKRAHTDQLNEMKRGLKEKDID